MRFPRSLTLAPLVAAGLAAAEPHDTKHPIEITEGTRSRIAIITAHPVPEQCMDVRLDTGNMFQRGLWNMVSGIKGAKETIDDWMVFYEDAYRESEGDANGRRLRGVATFQKQLDAKHRATVNHKLILWAYNKFGDYAANKMRMSPYRAEIERDLAWVLDITSREAEGESGALWCAVTATEFPEEESSFNPEYILSEEEVRLARIIRGIRESDPALYCTWITVLTGMHNRIVEQDTQQTIIVQSVPDQPVPAKR